jgi:malonyl-CoA/methylmalonyl-CoA synthetase
MTQGNLYALFQDRFAGREARVFLQMPDGQSVTYGEIDRLSGQLAAVLAENNVVPGDRVVAQLDKSPWSIGLYLACLRYGAVYVPLNTAYTAVEVRFFLSDAKPALFFCTPDSRDALIHEAAQAGVNRTLVLGDNPQSDWVAELEPYSIVRTSKPDDLAAMVYTSGTTGRSKGAMLSHKNLASNALTLHEIWGWRPGDVLLHALPVFHVHGLFSALHTAMLNASTVLFLPRFDVPTVIRLLADATVMMGVPTFYTRLLESPEFGQQECAHMRLFISGSAPLSAITFEEFRRRTGHEILERYGMTEAGMITSNPLVGKRMAGTVGYPLPDVEVRVVSESGRIAAPDTVGLIEARGPNVFKGYWRLPDKTAEEFSNDGFLRTGDLGSMSTDGRLSIVGRTKDLIISGGYNIYPKEIESCLDQMPGIVESAVIGAPHSDLGEAIVAVIILDATQANNENQILEYLQNRIARFKHPRRFIFTTQLPRNAMGKVQKNVLRAQYQDTFQSG